METIAQQQFERIRLMRQQNRVKREQKELLSQQNNLEKLQERVAKLQQKKSKNLFIHIPKTAGQSIFKSTRTPIEMHKEFKQMTSRVDDDTFVYAVIRNPYDRAVSLYYYLRSRIWKSSCRDWNAAMCCLAHGADVNEFWTRFITPKQFQFQCRQFPMMRPQIEFLNEKEPNVVSPRIDKILIFEKLNEDWEELMKIRGFQPLCHKNKGKNRAKIHWSEELKPETIAHLSNLYDKDFKTLPYQKYAN